MISLKKVDASIFPQVIPLLPELQDQFLKEDDWKILFSHSWEREEDYCGYGLFDQDRLVGFIGLLFSRRKIDGRIHRICNLTSWIVTEPYRDHSLSMLLPILRLDDYTITDLSASGGALRILRRLGFEELEQHVTVIPCLPAQIRVPGSKQILSQDPDLFEKHLDPIDLEIYKDHLHNASCSHFIFRHKNSYCYFVVSRVIYNTRHPYSFIHYASHPEIFSRKSRAICTAIARRQNTSFVAMDSRHTSCIQLPAVRFEIPLPRSRLYKSTDLKPDQIDNLYSELVLLNFSTIPSPVPDRITRIEAILAPRRQVTSG